MIRMILAGLALMLFAVPAAAQDAPARAEIEAAMAASAAGWNAGDLDRFLAVYSDDPSTTFTGSKGTERGKAAIRARYIKSYPAVFGPEADGKPQRLWFTPEDFRMLGTDHALLIAQWHLDAAGDEDAAEGMTSLVFHREAGGWKIIADHSD
ncbi:YybH family protein [Stakelama marina]|uniref:SgcJ/EcaC family oxidoreductase n=1 Tax=Stakelama marina TaxID=2826939 RepID=A0A8T4IAK9_9SPHN|nr:nuclear transport factor 2 family protein [Stakelama marina]MBR0551697.1 SgcJ/EcaC family oxidoreductase [Stakelama marina]